MPFLCVRLRALCRPKHRMFLSVAALMPLAHGDLSRRLGDVCEWLCVHVTQQRLMTALTEKTEGKVIHHWGYASGSSSSTTESSSGHYSVRSLQSFSISSWPVLSLSYRLPVSLGTVSKTCIQGYWIGTQTSKSFVMHLNIIKTKPPLDDTLYCVITNCHLINIASCSFLCDVIS